MLEKNGLPLLSTKDISEIRRGKVPEKLAAPPWELSLKEAEEMLDSLLGYKDEEDENV